MALHRPHLTLWYPTFFLLTSWLIPASLFAQSAPSDSIQTIFIANTVFIPGQAYRSGDQNWSVATGDMNGDQQLDLVGASKTDGKIFIHYNDGKGGFHQKASFEGHANQRALCLIDANGDGHLDVASVSLTGKLGILLNDGKGNLKLHQLLESGVMSHDVIALDVNDDGKMDLLTAVVNAHAIKLFLNQGGGKFKAGMPIPTGRKPRVVEAGDLNGDGKPDLVVGGDNGRLYLHFQKGNHRFAPPVNFRSTLATWGLALGDLNGDGHLDIAAASYLDKSLYIHLNHGDGTFAREQEIMSGDRNFDVIIRDFDLDGDQDVATCSILDRALNLHLNDGTGIIGLREEITSGDWNSALDAGDFDGDGDPDLVLSSVNDGTLIVHRNLSAQEEIVQKDVPCVQGIVFDEDSREPIANAQVALQSNGWSVEVIQTDEKGAFSFCPPIGKAYEIVVRATTYPVYREPFVMPNEEVEKHLYLAHPKGSFVYGSVRDEISNRRLPETMLTLRDALGELVAEFPVDSLATYHRELAFGKNYSLEAQCDGYQTKEIRFDLDESHLKEGKRVNVLLPRVTEACLTGVVRDEETMEPIPHATVRLRNLGTFRSKGQTATNHGSFEYCVPFGEYELSAKAKGYFFKVEAVDISQANAEQGKQQDILLRKLEKDAILVLEHIHYDVDKATLRDASIEELDRVVEILRDNPSLVVEISSHTDSDASDEYNIELSQARAKGVVDYLLAAGIYSDRLEAKGYGETRPVAPNDTKANKQKNRRTEFRVLSWEQEKSRGE